MAQYPSAPHVMQSQPDYSLPNDIYQLALQHQIGEFRVVYKPRVTNPVAIILGLVLLVVLEGIMAFFIFNTLYEFNRFTIVLLALPVFGIIYCLDALFHCRHRVYLFTFGIIYIQGKQQHVIRWDQIKAVWHTWKRQNSGDLRHKYVIQHVDGTQYKLESFTGSLFVNATELGTIIEQEVAQVLLPLCLAAFDVGETIPFGKLQVSIQGLTCGKQFFPWYQVGVIEATPEKLSIRQGNTSSILPGIRPKDVPNLPLLLMLVQHSANRMNHGLDPSSLPGLA